MLERITIASPCNVPWDSMAGNDRRRHVSGVDAT